MPKSITVKRASLNRRKTIAAGVLVIFLAACTPGGSYDIDNGSVQLVVTQFPEQRELARYRLGPDKTFSLSFIHSVSKTRVTDVYEIRAGKIIQIKEFFRAHGAGLPSNTDEPGGISWEKTEDWFILHMERPIVKLVVRTDKLYQNRLATASMVIDLNQWEDQPLLLYAVNGEW